jgi:signal transduction histidine kinase
MKSIDFSVRTSTFYAAEAVVGLFLVIIFFYFSKAFSKHFVKMWAYSWLAFVLAMVVLMMMTIGDVGKGNTLRHVYSFVSILLQEFQIFFLLVGSIELVRYRRISKKGLILWSAAITAVALCVVLPFAWDPDGANARYLLRLGFRYFIVGTGFSVAGYITVRSMRLTSGIGKTLIAVSFFMYGLYHFYYLVIVISNVFSQQFTFPFLFGVVELIIVTLTGLSMAIWMLEDERQALFKTNRELDDFFYRVSHDLKAPITSMQGINNIARLELKEPDARTYVEMMDRSISKLNKVIFDLMELSRNRLIESKLTSINFNLLVDDIRRQISLKYDQSRVNLAYVENNDNVLISDRGILKTILLKLIDNAVVFNKNEQASIRIDFVKESGRFHITVEDNGIGIHKESLPKIFNMFYKENSQTPGSGLGLYVVKDMIEKLNGSISAQSGLGQGSKFIILLPAV